VAMAYVAETRGVYRPVWSIEDMASHSDAIRDSATSIVFPTVPSGQLDHLRYSFAMARS
jgi:hypothetical protein